MEDRRAFRGGMSSQGFHREQIPDQDVTNSYWPPGDAARRTQAVEASRQIAVEARIVWKQDGEQWVPATAIAWWRDHVKLHCDDPRLLVPYVWLAAADVRRSPTNPAASGT